MEPTAETPRGTTLGPLPQDAQAVPPAGSPETPTAAPRTPASGSAVQPPRLETQAEAPDEAGRRESLSGSSDEGAAAAAPGPKRTWAALVRQSRKGSLPDGKRNSGASVSGGPPVPMTPSQGQAKVGQGPVPGTPSGAASVPVSAIAKRRATLEAAVRAAVAVKRTGLLRHSRSHSGLGGKDVTPEDVAKAEALLLAKKKHQEVEEEEVLEGLRIEKPFDRSKRIEEGASSAPRFTRVGFTLQQSKLFKGLGDLALMELASGVEERVFRAGEVAYRENEKQQWLGIIESGSLKSQIPGDVPPDPAAQPVVTKAAPPALSDVATITAGGMFGELAALGVRETRASTLVAETECHVLVLDGRHMWAVLENHPEDKASLTAEADRWRSFLRSSLAAACHPEIAYQLRMGATLRTMMSTEEIQLGSSELEAAEQTAKFPTCAAIIESGRAITADQFHDALGAGSTACDAAVLGLKGTLTIKCANEDAVCYLALVSREAFWSLISKFPREKEAFIKLALDRLPPSTFDISSCTLLTHLMGSANFARVVQGLVKQRIVHPGQDVVSVDERTDALSFFQQGSAEVILGKHKIRKVHTGSYCGELNFLAIASISHVTVRALDFCVLQELRKADLEIHLSRHHTVRTRFRELTKLRPAFKRDSVPDLQLKQLKDCHFFADLWREILLDIFTHLEDQLYLPGQVIMSEADSGDCMSILLEGTADRTPAPDALTYTKVFKVGAGDTIGEMGLLCDLPPGSRDTLVATSICCTQTMHRSLLLECLQRHPEAKRHFESIAKAFMMRQTGGEGDQMSNIYMLPFFKNCGSRFLYLLDLHLDRHIFFSDETIVSEGTEGEDMYILYSGDAAVTVRGTKVGALTGGMCFGEMAVLGLVKKRTATIVARTLCDVRILSKKSLDEAIREFPEERSRFESLAATRNRISMEKRSGGKVRQTGAFFKDCDPHFAAALSDSMEDQLYLEGQVIMSEGEEGDWMILLHQGKADVLVGGQKIADLMNGEIAGEMAVLGISPVRTATVVAVDTCFVQVLRRAQLLPILKEFPHERQNIRIKAAQRLESRYTVDTVRSLPVFKNFPRDFTDFIDHKTLRWVFFMDDVMLKEGAPGSHLLMLFSGRVAVQRGGETFAELGRGEVLGELAVMGLVPRRSASVVCKEICDVYAIKKPDILSALQRWPEQSVRFRNIAASRMRRDVERDTKEKFLLNCPLFEQCSAKFLQCISQHLEDRLYMPGDHLCVEGEPGDTMFIIMLGTLSCIVGEVVVGEMTQGSIIGEIAVLGLSTVRTASLLAQTVCLVQVLHRPIFMKYLAEFPREMIHFQEVGAARLERIPITGETCLFRKQTLFRDGSVEFLDRLSQSLHRKFFFANQKIIKEGTESNEMYAISQGRASVERRGTFVGDLEAGYAFGELAVLGVASMQTLSIRAETLCDMQVLSRWDLEALMSEYEDERKRLLHTVALMMREDFADVTDLEIISDIPLVQEFEPALAEQLTTRASVELARKDEVLFSAGAEMLFVLLQGSAMVEVGGTIVRDLSEGDSFGEPAVLGLLYGKNLTVRASNSCLYLVVTREDFLAAVDECGARSRKLLQNLNAKLNAAPGMALMMLGRSPVLQHLRLTADQKADLVTRCEELVFLSGQEVLSPPLRPQVMLFLLAGRVRIEGDTSFEPGTVLGDVSMDPPQVTAFEGVFAVTPCKVLLLYRKAFFTFIDGCPAEEKERLYQQLQSLPKQQQASEASAALGSNLKQRAERLAEQCILAAKMSLKASGKTWGTPKTPQANGARMWRTARMSVALSKIKGAGGHKMELADDDMEKRLTDSAAGPGQPKSALRPVLKQAAAATPRAQRRASTPPSPQSPFSSGGGGGRRDSRAATPPSPRAPGSGRKISGASVLALAALPPPPPPPPPVIHKRSLKALSARNLLTHQQELLCRDLRKLIGDARATAEEANRDNVRLRKEVERLRHRFAAVSSAPGGADEDSASDGSGDGRSSGSSPRGDAAPHPHAGRGILDGAEEEAIRRAAAASRKRIEALEARIKEATATRRDLLSKLGCEVPPLTAR